MADFSYGNRVRAVVDGPLRRTFAVRPAEERQTITYWCLNGHGIEKVGVEETWMTPELGRAQRPTGSPDFINTPHWLLRDLRNQLHRSGAMPVVALFKGSGPEYMFNHGAAMSQNPYSVFLHIVSTHEGVIPIVAEIGSMHMEHPPILFKRGMTVEAMVRLKDESGPVEVPDNLPYLAGQSSKHDSASQGPPSPPATEPAAKRPALPTDPLTAWNRIRVTCDWIQQKDKPETRVRSGDTRRINASQIQEVTFDAAESLRDELAGREITWRGRLLDIRALNNETQLGIYCPDSTTQSHQLICFTRQLGFVDELRDYIGGSLWDNKGDAVTVRGVLRPRNTIVSRLGFTGPVVELQDIVRDDAPSSRATVGQTRSQDSFDPNRQEGDLARAIRVVRAPGTELGGDAVYDGYDSDCSSVYVKDTVSEGLRIRIWFPGCQEGTFSGYHLGDRISISTIIHGWDKDGQLVLQGDRIARKEDPRLEFIDIASKQTDDPFKKECDLWWNGLRLERFKPGGTYRLTGVLAGRTRRGDDRVRVKRLFLGASKDTLELAVPPGDQHLLEPLVGHEVLFAVTVLGKGGLQAGSFVVPRTRLLWMAPLDNPEQKAVFSVPQLPATTQTTSPP